MKKVRSPPTVASRRASTRLFWFLRQHQLQHKHNPPVAYFSRHLRADHLFFFFFQAYELSVLTGTQVLLLVVSETGLVYTFTTPKLQPLVTKPEGKNLIQACLNAPEPSSENGVDATDLPAESPEDVPHSSVNAPQANIPRPGGLQPGYMTHDQQQQMAYYQNLQQQQQQAQAGGQYPGMPVGGRMPPPHQPAA
jgi:MADS-box transcription factor